jgi:hypothetical protein
MVHACKRRVAAQLNSSVRRFMIRIADSQLDACPRCHLTTHVSCKLLLINPAGSHPSASQSVWRSGCSCEGFSVDDLKPEFANLGQFIVGLYCESCSVGYIPEAMIKALPPAYQPSPEGWRRVFPDGTRGPLLQRIADDPESQTGWLRARATSAQTHTPSN